MNFTWYEAFTAAFGIAAVILAIGWAMSWANYRRSYRAWRNRVQTLTQQLSKADGLHRGLAKQLDTLRMELEEKRAMLKNLQVPMTAIPADVAGVKQMNEVFITSRQPASRPDFEATQIL